MKTLTIVGGGLAAALGALWLLQGLGIVRLRPLLCVTACEGLQGPSAGWAIAGAALLLLGVAALVYGLRRR
jgi:hypothetical protein